MVELADVTAAVLAGGLGTRLRAAVADRPKVLANVSGRPFVAYLLDQLADAGVRRVVLCTCYRADQVKAALGLAYRDLQLIYSEEGSPLGTGGALRLALPALTTKCTLVMNGDSFCETDLGQLKAWHDEHQAAGTILLARVADTSRFGSVEMNEQSRVTAFREKSGGGGPGWINAGIYLLRRELLEGIPSGRSVSLERDVFPSWIGRGLYGFRSPEGRFLDIGTPESYAEAEHFLARERS